MKKISFMLLATLLAGTLSVSFAAQKPAAYTGEIQKNDGSFVFVEASSKSVYQLDNQKKSKDFAGVPVIVTGTLDPATNTIHVKGIQVVPGIQDTVQWGVR